MRAVRTAATVTVAVAVRLVPVQRGGVRRLRIVHVLREGALLPLWERRGGGSGTLLVRRCANSHAARLRGRAGAATALSVPLLAPARVSSGRRRSLRSVPPLRLPMSGASATALQYYLVPPHAARALRGTESTGARSLYKYLLPSGASDRVGMDSQ